MPPGSLAKEEQQKKILLMGPPNVGKSVIFNKLTGLDAMISNYTGTTIDYKEGYIKDHPNYHLIDVPGTYTLDATNEAEKVATDMLTAGADLVVAVLDAKNLESSIYLLLQILEKNLPTIVVINRIDILAKEGFIINERILSSKLGLDVIKTIAIEEEGLKKLKNKISALLKGDCQQCLGSQDLTSSWELAEELTIDILARNKKEKSSRDDKIEQVGDMLSRPWPGIPLAFLILAAIFALVVGIGMGLRQYILLPLFTQFLFPLITAAVESVIPAGIFRNILIGEYGFLIKGLEWPFALVLPYVISFYTALSILEDVGYLPRLGVLLDGIFSKIGLSGANIIPLLLGYGCAIPGIAATRAMPTQKERVMVSTMICLAIPCISQTGAMISLLAEESILVMLLTFMVSFLVLIANALVLNHILPGQKNATVVEIPPLLFSGPKILAKKIWLRIKTYLKSGAVMMIYAIAGAAVLFEIGLLEYVGRLLQPLVESWLLLPAEASTPLILGIVRRELAVLPLLEMNLTGLQLFTGALVALFYVPCIAVLAMLAREFNLKLAAKITIFTIVFSLIFGGLVAQLGGLFI